MAATRASGSPLNIREASSDDAQAILGIYAPIVTNTVISFEEQPPTVGDIVTRIDRSNLWLVCEEETGISGYAYASRFHARSAYRWSTEVSIYLAEDARGKGLGRTLLGALLEQLRWQGFVNAFAGTTLPNEASVRLFESLGFTKAAHWSRVGFKLGAWHDVAWWQLQLREPAVPPPSLGPAREIDI